jgi:hypothetical protein
VTVLSSLQCTVTPVTLLVSLDGAHHFMVTVGSDVIRSDDRFQVFIMTIGSA